MPTMTHTDAQRKAYYAEREHRKMLIAKYKWLNHRNYAQAVASSTHRVQGEPHKSGGEGPAVLVAS